MAVPASAADQSVTATPSSEWSPDDVTIDLGDTVTWNNGGGVHNVEFNDGSFTQPPQPSTSQWTVERTFDTAGDLSLPVRLPRRFDVGRRSGPRRDRPGARAGRRAARPHGHDR